MSTDPALRPVSGVIASGDPGYPWQSDPRHEPVFEVTHAARLADRWLSLDARIRCEGGSRDGVSLRLELGAEASLHAPTRMALYPDSSGRIRFIWRALPDVRALYLIPARPGMRFAIDSFRLVPTLGARVAVRSAFSALRGAARGDLRAKALAVRNLWRAGGTAAVVRRLLALYNLPARLPVAISNARSSAAADGNEPGASSGRLRQLESYVAEALHAAHR